MSRSSSSILMLQEMILEHFIRSEHNSIKSESRFRERFSTVKIMNQEKLSLEEILSMIEKNKTPD